MIKDYGELLPKPYTQNGRTEIEKLMVSRELSLDCLETESLQSVDNLEKALNELPTRLRMADFGGQDTLVPATTYALQSH